MSLYMRTVSHNYFFSCLGTHTYQRWGYIDILTCNFLHILYYPGVINLVKQNRWQRLPAPTPLTRSKVICLITNGKFPS